ncbi:e3 ubiquitin-protein ligase HERC2-like [Planoprotostelium fungivorum]|uniref:E3 ubiquitin-protein ligase HERC2-like n=1 Tax=Planoprotostelium fungivorum TaxID=1890364 RepID=A0A2P6NIF7_9EUKA|nr:e3 ubiquitin-protein ligase HERC2-like [Planoprotostelium fungivorum]
MEVPLAPPAPSIYAERSSSKEIEWLRIALSIERFRGGQLDWSNTNIGPSLNWMVSGYHTIDFRPWWSHTAITDGKETVVLSDEAPSGVYRLQNGADCGSPLYFYTLIETFLLNRNRIVTFPEIAFLRNVKHLDLSDNHIQSFPDAINQLEHLQVLKAHNNPIRGISEVHMKAFTSHTLKTLTMDAPTFTRLLEDDRYNLIIASKTEVLVNESSEVDLSILRRFRDHMQDVLRAETKGGSKSSVQLHTRLYINFSTLNLNGQLRKTGGCQYTATLIRSFPSPLSIQCEVIDLQNGSYSISYLLTQGGEYEMVVRTHGILALKVPITCLETSASAFRWGTGGGDIKYYDGAPKPQPMESLGLITISKISSGPSHTVFISGTGATFGYGDNSCGQLGHPSSVSISCGLEQRTHKHQGMEVSCGKSSTSILVEGGDIYSFGDGKYGMNHLESLRRHKIVALTYAFGMYMGLSAKGEVFSWRTHSDAPSRDSFLTSHHVKQLAGSFSYLLAVTDEGKKTTRWLEVLPNYNIKQVLMALDAQGNVYTWTEGPVHKQQIQLGQPADRADMRVNFGNHVVITQIAMGTLHCAALTTEGKMYLWGSGSYGQIGFGSTEDIPEPQHMSSIKQRIYSILATGNETFAMITPQQSRLGEDMIELLRSGDYSDDGMTLTILLILARCPVLAQKFSERINEEFLRFLYGNHLSTDITEADNRKLRTMVDTFHFQDLASELESNHNNLRTMHMYKKLVNQKSLLSRGQYFKGLLSSGMKESSERRATVHNLDDEALLSLLEWIYSDDVADLSVDTALDLLQAADEFVTEQRLRDICTSLIRQNIDHETVCYVLPIAIMTNSRDLQNACMDLIYSRFSLVKETETYMNLSNDLREEIEANLTAMK